MLYARLLLMIMIPLLGIYYLTVVAYFLGAIPRKVLSENFSENKVFIPFYLWNKFA